MDEALARRMAALTQSFYQRSAESFSATRQAPWDGWQRVWELSKRELGPFDAATPLKVLDIGAGNLRFERFLEQEAESPLHAWAIDSCQALIAAGLAEQEETQLGKPLLAGAHGSTAAVAVRPLDVMALLADGANAEGLARAFDAPLCDVAVAFGFLHHVPRADWRSAILQAMATCVRPGGLMALSLWQFADDARLRAKADEATARGISAHGLPALPENDYLLGWQDDPQAFRYCHHFTETEVDTLAASVAPHAREVARFSADGRTGSLNRYLLLQRVTS